MTEVTTGSNGPDAQQEVAAGDASEPNAREELQLMQTIYEGLEKHTPEVRHRILTWVLDRLDTPLAPRLKKHSQEPAQHDLAERTPESNVPYATFAELYDAAGPTTGGQMALVGGYWFQVCQRQEDFVAADVNNQLKDAGAKVANITVAFNGLIETTPRLALQVKKSGTSKQARKRYKLTTAGIREVERMISGAGDE
jgi:hypothetical protein